MIQDTESYELSDFGKSLLREISLVGTVSRNDLTYFKENLNYAIAKLSLRVDNKDDPDFQESNEVLLDYLKTMESVVINYSKKVDKIFSNFAEMNKEIYFCGEYGRLDENTILMTEMRA